MKTENCLNDVFGFRVIGFDAGNSPQDNITAIEDHIEVINGLHNESVSILENKISELKKQLEGEVKP